MNKFTQSIHSRLSKILIRNQSPWMGPLSRKKAFLGRPEYLILEILANGLKIHSFGTLTNSANISSLAELAKMPGWWILNPIYSLLGLTSWPPEAANARPLGLKRHSRGEDAFKEGLGGIQEELNQTNK